MKIMKNKAQVSIEFSIGLIVAILFLILTCNLFVWFNHCLTRRQVAYEDSRAEAGGNSNPGGTNFYTPPTLNVFSPGGRE
jgi:uncharacterized protein (UPF0333 family)